MGIYNSDKKDYEELFKEKMNEAKLMHNLSDENKKKVKEYCGFEFSDFSHRHVPPVKRRQQHIKTKSGFYTTKPDYFEPAKFNNGGVFFLYTKNRCIALYSVTQGVQIRGIYCDQKSTVIMIRKRIVKAVLVFYREALIYKAFSCFQCQDKCPYQNYKFSFY